MGITHCFFKKFKEMKKIVKIISFRGHTGNSGGDGGRDRVLNSNPRGIGRGKMAGERGMGSLGSPWHPYSLSNRN